MESLPIEEQSKKLAERIVHQTESGVGDIDSINGPLCVYKGEGKLHIRLALNGRYKGGLDTYLFVINGDPIFDLPEEPSVNDLKRNYGLVCGTLEKTAIELSERFGHPVSFKQTPFDPSEYLTEYSHRRHIGPEEERLAGRVGLM